MSISCPRCGNSIDQDFGVITCNKCAAVLFVDMEGQAQISGESSSGEASESSAAEPSFGSEQPPSPDFSFQPDEALGGPEINLSSQIESYQETPQTEEPTPQSLSQPHFNHEEASMMYDAPLDPSHEAAVNPGNDFLSESVASSYEGSANSLSEVSDFGNVQQGFGQLSYRLVIENIDTGLIRDKVYEVLSDSKFQWDAKEILAQIEKGRLQLDQLNPVKASVLVKRLQSVSVKVSWVQKLL